jgi:hypothetical protein
VKRLAIAAALCGSFICTPSQAKTFVGVLWPMGGPFPAIGLVELVGELKMMPDVEVKTYLHQSWPSLVEDIDHLPPGTHTVVVGYSLGANDSTWVANKAKFVDLIIALQPSMLSWNPPVTGKVGRMIEIYNPNPWMTFGGMGSKKLIGGNIEYIATNDSHPGAQFSPEFRSLVKREIAKFTAGDRVQTARAEMPKPVNPMQRTRLAGVRPADERPIARTKELAAKRPVQVAQAEMPEPSRSPESEPLARQRPRERSADLTRFLDKLSRSVNSGDLFVQEQLPRRQLTMGDMKGYVQRTYRGSPVAGLTRTASD